MNGLGNWLRQLGMKFRMGITRFMTGRYGTDKLNTVILTAGLIACVVSVFTASEMADLVLTLVAYGFMFWAMFRSFSRNTYKRYQENRKFLMLVDKLKDRDPRYFHCPKCRPQVRVPKGKGKIAITCPKCKEKFIKKT